MNSNQITKEDKLHALRRLTLKHEVIIKLKTDVEQRLNNVIFEDHQISLEKWEHDFEAIIDQLDNHLSKIDIGITYIKTFDQRKFYLNGPGLENFQ